MGNPSEMTDLPRAMEAASGEVGAALDRLLPPPTGPHGRVAEAMRYAEDSWYDLGARRMARPVARIPAENVEMCPGARRRESLQEQRRGHRAGLGPGVGIVLDVGDVAVQRRLVPRPERHAPEWVAQG